MAILATTTAKQIIQEALELLGAIGEGELANSAQEASLLRTLNNMCVMWQADGLNLFAYRTLIVFLQKDKIKYRIPQDRVTTSFWNGRTNQEVESGTSQLHFDKEVDTSHQWAGFLDSDGVMQWYSIFDSDGMTITLNTTFTEDIPEGTLVYTYESVVADRFMKAVDCHIWQETGTSIPMHQMSRQEYDALSRKDNSGVPLQFYADPQTLYQDIYIWPVASKETQILQLGVQAQLDTAVNVANDIAYPAEWFMPLATNLAYVSSAKYGLPVNDTRRIQALATDHYEMAKGFDFEWGTSVFLEPEHRW